MILASTDNSCIFGCGSVNVAVARIDAAPVLTSLQATEVDAIAAAKRRRERAATYSLVNAAIAHGLLLGHHADGAPYLMNEAGAPLDICFSLSHSRSYVAIAWREGSDPVGIDIEQWSDKLMRVASRFLSPLEMATLADDHHALLAAWTLKEAAYKAALTPGLPLVEGIVIKRYTPASDGSADWRIAIDGRHERAAHTFLLPSPQALLTVVG